jgi:hypothetical protein
MHTDDDHGDYHGGTHSGDNNNTDESMTDEEHLQANLRYKQKGKARVRESFPPSNDYRDDGRPRDHMRWKTRLAVIEHSSNNIHQHRTKIEHSNVIYYKMMRSQQNTNINATPKV